MRGRIQCSDWSTLHCPPIDNMQMNSSLFALRFILKVFLDMFLNPLETGDCDDKSQFIHDRLSIVAISNKDTFARDFLVILKRTVMLPESSQYHTHPGVLPVARGYTLFML